ncbi:hypothetical protein PI125_g11277 [Phytophthora idaei]|nr:hypothetical protein PI125_g11277 [Phytophthora idaei]KAG3149908.1 hypothetical protein PI126_g11794 [Phytophthora idaei]
MLKLFKCQPSRNLLRHLASCPSLDEPNQLKWRRFGEPAKKNKRKRQRRKKRSKTQSPDATQDSIMTEAVAVSHGLYGGIGSAKKKRFQSEIERGFYAAGLPFRTIEVPRKRRVLTILQPEMEQYLPMRKALTGRLLTDEFDREKAVRSRSFEYEFEC